MTNAHVIEEARDNPDLAIGIVPSDGDEAVYARIAAVSDRNDLALLATTKPMHLPPLTIAGNPPTDSGAVVSVGYPMNVDRAQGLKAGDILTFEGGLGRSFYARVDATSLPRITTVGVVYYGQFKVTGDSASVLTPLIEGKKDHVFGVGAEANVFLPKPKLLLGLRVVPEFRAVNRTQGLTLTVTLAYQAKLLVKGAVN